LSHIGGGLGAETPVCMEIHTTHNTMRAAAEEQQREPVDQRGHAALQRGQRKCGQRGQRWQAQQQRRGRLHGW
jgi:DNA repair ATPase RecN